jgi:hypothetical protein
MSTNEFDQFSFNFNNILNYFNYEVCMQHIFFKNANILYCYYIDTISIHIRDNTKI